MEENPLPELLNHPKRRGGSREVIGTVPFLIVDRVISLMKIGLGIDHHFYNVLGGFAPATVAPSLER